jgi:hypothetical protein
MPGPEVSSSPMDKIHKVSQRQGRRTYEHMCAVRIHSLPDVSFWVVNERDLPDLCRDLSGIRRLGTSREVVLELHAQGGEIRRAPSVSDVPCQQNPDLVLGTVVGVVEFQAQMPG